MHVALSRWWRRRQSGRLGTGECFNDGGHRSRDERSCERRAREKARKTGKAKRENEGTDKENSGRILWSWHSRHSLHPYVHLHDSVSCKRSFWKELRASPEEHETAAVLPLAYSAAKRDLFAVPV